MTWQGRKQPELDVASLMRVARIDNLTALTETLGADYRGMQRAREGGFYVDQAEVYAVRLGFAPEFVWSCWLRLAGEPHIVRSWPNKECPDCHEWFVPVVHNKRFCSSQCRNRFHSRRQYQRNPEYRERRKAEALAAYYETRDYVRRRRRAYYAANREQEIQRARDWYDANKARVAQKRRERYLRNRDAVLANQREYDRRKREAS